MWKLSNFHFDLPQFYAKILSLAKIYCPCMRPCDKATEQNWGGTKEIVRRARTKLVIYKTIFTHLNLILSNSIMSWHLRPISIAWSKYFAFKMKHNTQRKMAKKTGIVDSGSVVTINIYKTAIGSSYHKSYFTGYDWDTQNTHFLVRNIHIN